MTEDKISEDPSQAQPPGGSPLANRPDERPREPVLWIPPEGLSYPAHRRWEALPPEVTVSSGGVALFALVFSFHSTSVLLALTAVLVEVHRELFQPALRLEHYLEALLIDYVDFVGQLRKGNAPAIAGLLGGGLCLWLAPRVTLGVVGTATVLLILLWAGLLSVLRGAQSPIAHAVETAAGALRPLLDQKMSSLVLTVVAAVPAVWFLFELFADLPSKAHVVLSIICAVAIPLLGLWHSSLTAKRNCTENLDVAILNSTNFIGVLCLLEVFCLLTWSLNGHERLSVGAGAVGILLSGVFWWKFGRGISNGSDEGFQYAGFSAVTIAGPGMLAGYAAGWSGTSYSAAFLLLAIVLWFFQVCVLLRLTSRAKARWVRLHLAMTACMLVALVTTYFSGGWGLIIALAPVGLILRGVSTKPAEAVSQSRA